jgi:hypothetical protein
MRCVLLVLFLAFSFADWEIEQEVRHFKALKKYHDTGRCPHRDCRHVRECEADEEPYFPKPRLFIFGRKRCVDRGCRVCIGKRKKMNNLRAPATLDTFFGDEVEGAVCPKRRCERKRCPRQMEMYRPVPALFHYKDETCIDRGCGICLHKNKQCPKLAHHCRKVRMCREDERPFHPNRVIFRYFGKYCADYGCPTCKEQEIDDEPDFTWTPTRKPVLFEGDSGRDKLFVDYDSANHDRTSKWSMTTLQGQTVPMFTDAPAVVAEKAAAAASSKNRDLLYDDSAWGQHIRETYGEALLEEKEA